MANETRNNTREQAARNTSRAAGPWGRAAAIIEPTANAKNPRFVSIGAVWKTENGNLKIQLEAEPHQWRDPHYRRTILITKNEDK